MPAPLRENQYELLPVDFAGEGLVFGTEETGYLTITRPLHSGGESVTGDTSRPGEDGIMFARDYYGGKTVSFELGVLTDVNNRGLDSPPASASEAHRANLDYLDALEGWWKDPQWRATANSMAMLRAKEASGEVYRAYGRPRRYDEAVGSLTRHGYTPVACDFQLIDTRWYSDTEYSASISLMVPPDGGLIAPLIAPLTTLREVQNIVSIDVGGKIGTWMVVEIVGPVQRPSVTIGDATYTLDLNIEAGDKVVIDPRPWARTVLRSSDGASVSGALTRESPLMSRMLVTPGHHTIQFRGLDSTGTARANLRWRIARSRP
jgi:rRNA processing protein Gar1